ncbi:HNH endonuclease [Curtobacterium sp. AG1037]|uniref:HNH endonuclease n=1 Tax=Curtobacterium sp. AG1037 TaxID=2183990 RepID=UPI0015F0C07B|nr:HNH endonuclease [Curtobacterium sp. AG1037]
MYDNYKRGCYFCKRKIIFAFIQIDHIIPRKTSVADGTKIWARVRPGETYPGIHNLANLAPICSECNGLQKKSDYLLPDGVLTLYLNEANEKITEIDEEIARLRDVPELELAALTIIQADIENKHQVQAISQQAQAVLETIAATGVSMEYRELEQIPLNLDEGWNQAWLLWEQQGREFDAAIRLVWQTGAVGAIARRAVHEVWPAVETLLYQHFGGRAGRTSETEASDLHVDYVRMDVRPAKYFNEFEGFSLELHVAVQASGNITILQQRMDGDGLEEDDVREWAFDGVMEVTYRWYDHNTDDHFSARSIRSKPIKDGGWEKTLQ